MSETGVFERNLSLLRKRNPKLVGSLEHVSTEGLEIVEGRREFKTFSHKGVLLASAYDPKREGTRMAQEMSSDSTDLLISLGFGLGYHIEAFRESNPCPVIIYEPSLSRLRVALSIRESLTIVGLKDVWFATDLDELTALTQMLYTSGLRVQVFPHPPTLSLDSGSIRDAVARISRVKESADLVTQTRVRRTAPWAQITIDNAPHLIKAPSLSRLFGKFEGVPCVVAAAGPSLDKQLPLLAREQGRLLVISIGQTVRSLQTAGVAPDLVHAIESQDVSAQITESVDPSAINLVLLPSVHERLFEVSVRSRFVSYPAANQIGCWIGRALGDTRWIYGGGTVAQSSVSLAVALGANPIMLIGQDLAYTGGRVYAAGSAYDYMGVRRTSKGRYELTNLGPKYEQLNKPRVQESVERDLVQVEGWDGNPVDTSVSYASFIEAYRGIGDHLSRQGIRLINCTEGGAKIAGLEHIAFADALAECADTEIDTGAIVHEAFDKAEDVTPEIFHEPMSLAVRSLDALERGARAGIKRVEGARTALLRARSPDRKIAILRRVGRSDRDVRRSLSAVPWLDALVQPAIHRSITSFRKAQSGAPSPNEAVEESRVLFEAVVEGIEDARALLDSFAAQIATETGSNSDSIGATINA